MYDMVFLSWSHGFVGVHPFSVTLCHLMLCASLFIAIHSHGSLCGGGAVLAGCQVSALHAPELLYLVGGFSHSLAWNFLSSAFQGIFFCGKNSLAKALLLVPFCWNLLSPCGDIGG